MSKMGHQEPKKSPAELFNPANWSLVGWAWVMLFVVAGSGIFVVVYQSAVAPRPAPAPRPSAEGERPRQVARYQRGGPMENDTRRTRRAHPDAYKNMGSRRGGGRSSSSGGNGSARASSGGEGPSRQSESFPKIFRGKHMNRTTPFTAPGQLTIQWSTSGPLFQLFVKKVGGGTVESPVSRSGLSGTTTGRVTVKAKGQIYFKVNSLGSWKLKVNA